MDRGDQKVLDDVAKFGWHVVLVAEDEKGPGFAYTVGLFQTFQHPEILVFGLDLELMHRVLNNIGERIRTGEQFFPGASCKGFLESCACEFRNVPVRWLKEYVGYNIWFYKDKTFELLQFFWPDKAGKFPWESEFSPKWKGKQPLLFQY